MSSRDNHNCLDRISLQTSQPSQITLTLPLEIGSEMAACVAQQKEISTGKGQLPSCFLFLIDHAVWSDEMKVMSYMALSC